MPWHDYKCSVCTHVEEDLQPYGTKTIECSECGEVSEKFYGKAPVRLVTIIPSYAGCKKVKAGYVHSHADRPSTKVQGRGFSSSSD